LPIIYRAAARGQQGGLFSFALGHWSAVGAIQGMAPVKMKMDTSIALCGWFKYYYYGKTDSAQVKFINSLDSTVYSSAGIGPGNFIDLSRGPQKTPTRSGSCRASLPNGPSLPTAPLVSKQYPNYSAQWSTHASPRGDASANINGIQPGGHADF